MYKQQKQTKKKKKVDGKGTLSSGNSVFCLTTYFL